MKQNEMRQSLRTALHEAINHWIGQESAAGRLKIGGITITGPYRIKAQLVDSEFRPHTYNILIEEAAK